MSLYSRLLIISKYGKVTIFFLFKCLKYLVLIIQTKPLIIYIQFINFKRKLM